MLICKNNTSTKLKIKVSSTKSITLNEGQYTDLLKDFSYRELAGSTDLAEKIKNRIVVLNSGGSDLKWLDALDLIRGYAEELPKDADGNVVMRTKAFADDDGFRKRVKGYVHQFDTKGKTEHIWMIEQERWMDGVELILVGHKTGDSIDLDTLDVKGVYAGKYYPSDAKLPFVLDDFGEDYYVTGQIEKQGLIQSNFLGRLLPGMAIRVIYNGTADTNTEKGVTMYLNLFANKKVSKPS